MLRQNITTDQVEYWKLKGMYELAKIYDDSKHYLHRLLRLHKIMTRLEMEEHDIKKIFELAEYNQLELAEYNTLQRR